MPNLQKIHTIARLPWLLALLLLTPLGSSSAIAQESNLLDAIGSGAYGMTFRYRTEHVDQDGIGEATASTLRSTLFYRTDPWQGFSGYVEVENVSTIGNELYNNGGENGVLDRAVVADPKGTEINQAYLTYKLGKTKLTAGRQDLTHGTTPFHRFVGNVLWRQNHQTYDGFRVQHDGIQNVTLDASYIHNANRIFGEDNPLPNRSDFDLQGVLARATWNPTPLANLSGYHYDLDFDDAVALSTTTTGLRLNGKASFDDGVPALVYTAEYATQSDTGDNPNNYRVGYLLGELGASYQGWLAKLSYEVLEADAGSGAAFQTPLATLHAFQGWADKFLATPAGGIKDLYLTVKGKVAGVNLLAVVHDYKADRGGFDYGREFNVQLTRKFGKVATGVKVAHYDADRNAGNVGGTAVDVTKVWLWMQMSIGS